MNEPLPTLADSRHSLRLFSLEQAQRDLADLAAPAESFGDTPGVEVVSIGNVRAVIAAIVGGPLPPVDVQTAEVKTPATIRVSAVCPRCDVVSTVTMTVRPELVIDDETSQIKLKAKAKPRTHVCGQLELPEPAQATLNLGVIEGGAPTKARYLSADEQALALVPSEPYPICGVTAVGVRVEWTDDEGLANVDYLDVVCGLVSAHDEVDAEVAKLGEQLGEEWATPVAHVQLTAPPLVWRVLLDEAEAPSEDVVPVDDGSGLAGAGDPAGEDPDAPVQE